MASEKAAFMDFPARGDQPFVRIHRSGQVEGPPGIVRRDGDKVVFVPLDPELNTLVADFRLRDESAAARSEEELFRAYRAAYPKDPDEALRDEARLIWALRVAAGGGA